MYRLPDATRLGSVHLQVADLDRSIDYYVTVLGLRLIDQTPDTVALGNHDEDVVLVRLTERAGVRPVPPTGLIGLFHFAIVLPSRALLGQFLRHLAESDVHPGMADHAVSEALYLHDPDGLGIEVYADRERSTWRRTPSGELYMTTEPLDVRSVINAAGGTRWQGMPRATTMGHVHLHVGSLEASEAFYRRAVGFETTVASYAGALFLAAGGYHHHLGTNIWSSGPPASEGDARLLWWEVVVPRGTRAALAANLEQHGHTLTRIDPALHVADPWGTTLRLLEA